MANSKNNPEQSLIAILSQRSAALYKRPDAEGFRTFTEAEHVEADAIATLIATTPAADRRDAAVQVAVAKEIMELWDHDLVGPERLEIAYAALVSASRVLGSARRSA